MCVSHDPIYSTYLNTCAIQQPPVELKDLNIFPSVWLRLIRQFYSAGEACGGTAASYRHQGKWKQSIFEWHDLLLLSVHCITVFSPFFVTNEVEPQETAEEAAEAVVEEQVKWLRECSGIWSFHFMTWRPACDVCYVYKWNSTADKQDICEVTEVHI